MTEADPFHRPEGGPKPTPVKFDGPNVISTFDAPPKPDAVRAHEAAIRKHLQGRRPGQGDGAGGAP
ncbi:MAG TPA: hypothetical protein VHW67_12580 [Solirubrobacteraceae bacterium]|jgi:hypothetical protein|nr:hypothetical protein [Solirubrobacteraceae bacterium]